MEAEKNKWKLRSDFVLEELELNKANLESSLRRLIMTSSVRDDFKKKLEDIKNKIKIIENNQKKDFSTIYK
jgi:hypothetical protein